MEARHLLPALIFLTLLLPGCRRPDRTGERAATDSLLASLNGGAVFSQPRRTDSLLRVWQDGLGDSLSWYKAEVFRGTCRNLMHDTAGRDSLYLRAEAWGKRTPEGWPVMGLLYNHRGVNALLSGREEEAFRCYRRAFALLDRPPKGRELISATINLADACLRGGDLPEAVRHYRYALLLCDSLGETSARTTILSGLGQGYMDLGNYPMAHRYFTLARKGLEREDAQTRYFYHAALGNLLYAERRYPEATAEFGQALAIARKYRLGLMLFNCECNLAEIALMQDSLPAARHHLQAARRIAAEERSTSSLALHYMESLEADLAIAEGREADAHRIMRGYADSLLAPSPRYLMLHHRRLERYAARRGDWRQAYQSRISADRYADSLADRQTRNNAIETESRYVRDTTLLRQRIAMADLRAHAARQRNVLSIALAATALFALTATLAVLAYRRRARKRLRRGMEQMTSLRMDIVRNRVSPHYIFNVLGTVLPGLRGYPELVKPLELLIDVLRGNLLASGRVAVPLADELRLVSRFTELHRLVHGPLPEVEWRVDEELRESPAPVPAMSLQIPVENALKHAFPDPAPGHRITITATRSGGQLRLCVQDNGCGYDPGRIRPTGRDTGTGLRLLSRTLLILNRYNRRPASLAIRNVPPPGSGTQVELLLPDGYVFTLPGAAEG